MEQLTQRFLDLHHALRKNEVWRNVDFTSLLSERMRLPQASDCDNYTFHCRLPRMETLSVVVVNGFCGQGLQTTDDGVVYGSMRDAEREYPDLVAQALDKTFGNNDYNRLNRESYSNGAFFYVPRGCRASKPLQLLSLQTANASLLLQCRSLMIVEDGASATIIQCDDSTNQQPFFANNVIDIVVGRDAAVEHYKLQNLNDQTGLLNHAYITLDEASRLLSVVVTLNGGHVCNHSEVRMMGEHSQVEVHGLYLNDRQQEVENYVYVDHLKPNCQSHELFKGILDDAAHASFNGHVMVREGAIKTEAYQQNRNILLTDKATVYTKPFLEIYNDDVKCSHGSTIGQLDSDAIFYLRSRGISERSAKTLMLYAFCDEVVGRIGFEPLRSKVADLVKQRLHGELTVCADCALSCDSPCGCNDLVFEIDPSLL